MKTHLPIIYLMPLLAALSFMGSGCVNLDPVPDPTRTFLLGAHPMEEDWAGPESPVRIAVERVEVASYLDDRRMLLRSGDTEIVYSNIYRWGEAMPEGIARALGRNLIAHPSVESVTYYPWKAHPDTQYRILLHVHQFEAWKSGAVRLEANYRILGPDKHAPFSAERSRSYEGRADPASVGERVRVMNRLLQQLAGDILRDMQSED